MKPQRYPCAPMAALLLAGAGLALLPIPAAAQGFSAGMNSAWSDGMERRDDRPPQFDRRRFEDARREMERRFDREREDRRDHRDGFTSGMHVPMRDQQWRDRSHVADKPTVTPGVAKSGAGMNKSEPDNLVGNRVAHQPSVAAPAGGAKNAQGGSGHHHVKGDGGNQGQQAWAKQGFGNQAANKNAAGMQGRGAGNMVGNRFGNQGNNPQAANANNGSNQGIRGFGNQGNPQAGNFNNPGNNGNQGNQGNRAFGNQGQGNPFANQQRNGAFANHNGAANRQQGLGNNMGQGQQMCAKQGHGNNAAMAKNGKNANNFAQMRGNLVGNRPTGNTAMHQHAGNSKSGAGHIASAGHRK